MLAWIPLVFAFPAADVSSTDMCEFYHLDGSIPADGAVEVSTDDPVVLLYRGGCGETLSWSLVGPSGLVADTMPAPEYVADGQVFRLTLPLVPEASYALTVTSDYGYEAPAEISFTTATAAAAGPDVEDVAISMEVIDVFEPQQGILDVLADIVVHAPAGSLVRMSQDGGLSTSGAWVADGSERMSTINLFTSTGQVCVSASAEDATGHAGAWVEACEAVEAEDPFPEDEVGLEPYKPSRCQSAPAPTSLLLLLPTLIGLRRRN
jgi:hypothetical protein